MLGPIRRASARLCVPRGGTGGGGTKGKCPLAHLGCCVVSSRPTPTCFSQWSLMGDGLREPGRGGGVPGRRMGQPEKIDGPKRRIESECRSCGDSGGMPRPHPTEIKTTPGDRVATGSTPFCCLLASGVPRGARHQSTNSIRTEDRGRATAEKFERHRLQYPRPSGRASDFFA